VTSFTSIAKKDAALRGLKDLEEGAPSVPTQSLAPPLRRSGNLELRDRPFPFKAPETGHATTPALLLRTLPTSSLSK
jgi:hypothetical protein